MKRTISATLLAAFILCLCACDFSSREDRFYEFASRLDTVVEEFKTDSMSNVPYKLSVGKNSEKGQYTLMLSTYRGDDLTNWINREMRKYSSSLGEYQSQLAFMYVRKELMKEESGSLILGKLRMKLAPVVEEYSEFGFVLAYNFSTADNDYYEITEEKMEQALHNSANSIFS